MSEPRTVSARRRREMIAQAAYYRAERRGFKGGDPAADWIAAEAEVDAKLRASRAAPAARAAPGAPGAKRMAGKAPENKVDKLGLDLAERLEEAAAAATRRLSALRRKVAGLKGDARGEWERDVERLAELRDGVRASLKELRKQGENASREARRRAETARAEVAAALERVAQKLRG
jgi:hypothetical protein